MRYRTYSAEETFKLAASLGKYLKPRINLLVDGDLAAGKTIFAKGLGYGLGIKEHIKSPSYTLLCIYEGGIMPLYHFDAYNLRNMDDFYDMGFDEYLSADGITYIEWASVIKEDFPEGYIDIKIMKTATDDKREIIFDATDLYHRSILKQWEDNNEYIGF